MNAPTSTTGTVPGDPNLSAVIERLPAFREAAEQLREVVLANLVLIGELPAPTGGEEQRVGLLLQRLSESGLQQCSSDELGNGFGVIPGAAGRRNLLVVTNADSLVERAADQHVEIETDRVIGPFVGDNSLALAALASLPLLLERAGLRLRSNLVVMAAARTHKRANLEGLRHFLEHSAMPLAAGLWLESVQLGRLNYSCLGMMRGEIVCRLSENYDWAQFGSTGTITPMNDIISRINKIPVPRRPMTSVIFGSIHGGFTYNNIARETILGFEVRSESAEILVQMREQLEDIVEEAAAQLGVVATLDIIARREPGGLDIGHPLVRNGRAILTALGIVPQLYATTSALSAFIERKVPAVTLAISTGERLSALDEIDEAVSLPGVWTGLAQLMGMLAAMDEEPAP
jgi:tripeptide aminopeptidase